jgi:hypothetical protein
MTPSAPAAAIAGRLARHGRAEQHRHRDESQDQHRARVLVEARPLAVRQHHGDRAHVCDGQELGHDEQCRTGQTDRREGPSDHPRTARNAAPDAGKRPSEGRNPFAILAAVPRGGALILRASSEHILQTMETPTD